MTESVKHNKGSCENERNTKEESIDDWNHRGHHLTNWATFWFLTWGGTTLAGGLFGGCIGMVNAINDLAAPLLGFVYGLLWAGGVGLFVFLHVGVICWTFWWLGRPIVVATVAGLLVGAICGLLLFSLITGPMGAAGAYLAGWQFLRSETGAAFRFTIQATKGESAGRLKFTTKDLFLRMTVISVMIAGWTAWIKAL